MMQTNSLTVPFNTSYFFEHVFFLKTRFCQYNSFMEAIYAIGTIELFCLSPSSLCHLALIFYSANRILPRSIFNRKTSHSDSSIHNE